MRNLICNNCGSNINEHRGKTKYVFCSKKCYGEWQSKNNINNNGRNWRGGKIKKNCLICNDIFLVNKSRSEEKLRGKYCSRKCYDKSQRLKTGINSSNWKGGVSKTNNSIRKKAEYKEWREEVFKRDDYTCQKYKIKGGILHPHHIKNFAEYTRLRFVISNGITLSEKAHKEFHDKYGRKNNTKKQIEEFFNIK